MAAPKNQFKLALSERREMLGLWVAMAGPVAAEICAGSGYDWILIDGEHGPNDIPSIAAQLQVAAAFPACPVVRLPVGETWIIKQALDIGAQSLLIPMVETEEQARQIVRACRYPPEGNRGVGAGLARAANYNRTADYLKTANSEICLIVQLESRTAIANLDAITSLEGVDAVFVGPSDLAADMGYLGNAGAPEVVEVVEKAIRRIVELGKPAGIMTYDQAFARRCLDIGASFVSFVSDVQLLTNAATQQLARFKGDVTAKPMAKSY